MWKEKENFEKNDSPNVRRDAADDYDANDTDANDINDNDVTMMLMFMLLMIHDHEPQTPAIWYCLETALWILVLKSSFANFLFLTIYISPSNSNRNREKNLRIPKKMKHQFVQILLLAFQFCSVSKGMWSGPESRNMLCRVKYMRKKVIIWGVVCLNIARIANAVQCHN